MPRSRPLPSPTPCARFRVACVLALVLAPVPAMPENPTAGHPIAGDPMPASTLEPLVHTLRFDDAEHHYVEVESQVPTEGRPDLELAMAVWTPGSYLVREYARHVEDLTASSPGDEPLPVTKVAKNRWRVETGGADEVEVRYRVYCREMTVRTNFVDDSFAILNGAPTFLAPVGPTGVLDTERPHEVRVIPRPGWSQVISALPDAPGAETGASPGERRFYAKDFDTLVDSPLYAGNAVVHRFEVDGAPHLLVNEGEQYGDVWDGPRSAADAERIVLAQVDFWGVRPYERYVFFNLITEARGGLEHKGSSVLMTSRWNARTKEGYRRWLGLVSHEFFHTWNVKRLRPVELGPFDYETEVQTPSLWIAEGVTSYYGDLLLRRAGLLTRDQYLERLSGTIERLQTTPGRRVQDLTDASFDAWIKQYRPDENTVNSAVSYYTKGEIAAWLLDAEIRRRTEGAKSLDDVMRAAWKRYSGERGFDHDEFLAVASEVAGSDLGAFFETTLESETELDYSPALEWLGLGFDVEKRNGTEGNDTGKRDTSKKDEDEPTAWLGAETEVADGRLRVTRVRRGTPAWEAGLAVEDELLAIDEFRVPPHELAERLKDYDPGESVELLVARRERLLRLPLTFGETPDEKRWKLGVPPDASEAQTARLTAWLGEESPAENAESR
jgi:predicted metalloprotease with PDZ domain